MSSTHSAGLLPRIVSAVAGASARRPRTVVALWMALVAACVAAGAMTGTKELTGAEAGVGESARAEARLDQARLADPAVESILLRSSSAATTQAAATALERRAEGLQDVTAVRGPSDTPENAAAGGKVVLVQATLRGDPDESGDRVEPLLDAVAAVQREHAGVTIQQAGQGSFEQAVGEVVEQDLRKAELISLPITLLILVLVFGAVVAALVPLLLGVTSVVAALGAMGVVSQIAPSADATSSLVVLIGLAVGVDYSLFYIRREREERRAGRDADAALRATAATVGRAVVVSGITVLLALAGLLVPGLAVFTSLGAATMVVVAIAILGSLTVLPATLALLGDRVDRGRIPGLARLQARHARRVQRTGGAWGRLAAGVTRRPAAALVVAACVLGAIAVPALDMKATGDGANSLPADTPIMAAERAIEQAFPGAPAPAQLVVTGEGLRSATARQGLERLGGRAREVTGGRGRIDVEVARDGRTALVSVPMPGIDPGRERATVEALRRDVSPTAGDVAFGAQVLVTGYAAESADFNERLEDTRWLVVAFVLGLALVLMLLAFRSLPLAAAVMGLNLLSVGAAYGVLTAVFQNEWAEGLLDFTSDGTVANWLPLNAFVILFGLSMDYTILVLERVREARAAGRSPREAAADGVGATGSTITSAAVVMVAIFAIFPTLPMIEMKQLGVCLAVGVLLDATIVRGLALPATIALLGERGVRAPRRRVRRGAVTRWDDAATAPADAR